MRWCAVACIEDIEGANHKSTEAALTCDLYPAPQQLLDDDILTLEN